MTRSLDILIGGDISGLQAAMARGASLVSGFAGNVSRSLGGAFNGQTFTVAGRSISQFSQQAQGAATAISVGLSAPLGLLGKQAISTFGEMDSLRRGLATLEKDATSLQARMSKLNEIAKLPGLGMEEAIAGDIRLRTVLNSIYGVEKAAAFSERTMKGFGNAVALVGKGKSEFERALYGVQQLANTPFPLGEDLNIIKDAIPQVTPLLNAAFGTSRSDDFKKLGISSKQVMETILDGLDKLPRASGGAANTFENFGDTTKKALDGIGQTLFKALRIGPLLDAISSAITGLVEKFTALPATTQTVVSVFGLLAVALPPLIAGIGFFTSSVLPALRTGLAATRVALAAMTGPIGLFVLAIAAAAVLIITHWDSIKNALVNSGVWTQLKGIVSAGLGIITGIFGVFANLFQADWSAMWEHIKNTLKFAWNGIISILGAGVLAMGGLIAKAFSLVGLDGMAKAVASRMDEVQKVVESRKFKIDAPKFDLFEGFNFGGGEPAKSRKNTNAGGKKKKEKETDTYIEAAQKNLANLQEMARNFSGQGLQIPDYVIKSISYYTDVIKKAEDALKDLQRIDLSQIKPIDSRNVIGTNKEGDAQAERYQKFNKALNGGGELLAPKLPNLDKFQKDLTTALKPVKKAFVDLNKGISEALSQAAQSAFEGMGEIIGGLIAGTAGLEQLPSLLLGVLGDLLSQLGRMAIAVGLGVQAIQTALKTLNPFVAIAAGIGLIALGAIVKSGASKLGGGGAKAFANGGTVSGPTYSLTGEYANARTNPEFIAPVNKGASIIAEQLMSMGAVGGNGGTLTTRVSGSDLLFVLTRAQKQSKVTGNG